MGTHRSAGLKTNLTRLRFAGINLQKVEELARSPSHLSISLISTPTFSLRDTVGGVLLLQKRCRTVLEFTQFVQSLQPSLTSEGGQYSCSLLVSDSVSVILDERCQPFIKFQSPTLLVIRLLPSRHTRFVRCPAPSGLSARLSHSIRLHSCN